MGSNFPVAFPSPLTGWPVKESELDIWAQFKLENKTLNLLVECKKNNPIFVDWIFFPDDIESRTRFLLLPEVNVHHELDDKYRVSLHISYANRDVFKRKLNNPVQFASQGRETRGKYAQYQNASDKTKTSNAAIEEAAYQVALATQAMILSTLKVVDEHKNAPPWRQQIFVPVVVTTANLFKCDFEPSQVNPATGEIPYASANLKRCPYLVFFYPLRPHLQDMEASVKGTGKTLVLQHERIPIFIVHSEQFTNFLIDLGKVSTELFSPLPN